MSEGTVDSGPTPRWTHQVKTVVGSFILLIAAVAFVYVAAYVTLVKRREQVLYGMESANVLGPGFVIDPNIRDEQAVEIHLVTFEGPTVRIAPNLFRPIHNFDLKKVRTRYWHTYAIFKVNGATETNWSRLVLAGPLSTNYAIFLPRSSFTK